MNMTEFSWVAARALTEMLEKEADEADVIRFGIEVFVGEGIKLLILIYGAMFLDMLWPVMTVYLTAGVLRLISGGAHLTTYRDCLLVSTGTFLGFGLLSKILAPALSGGSLAWVLGTVWLAVLVMVLRYAPADNPAKPVTSPEERKRFKILSSVFVILWGLAMFTMWVFLPGERTIVLASTLAVLFQSITLTPGAYQVARWLTKAERKGGENNAEKA